MEFYKRISYTIKNDPIEHVLRSFSGAIAINMSRTKITPNQVTLLRSLIIVPNFYLFALGEYMGYLIGSILMVLNTLFDYVDGDLARITKKTSQTGEWLESLFDAPFAYLHSFLGFFLAIGIYKETGIVEVWPVLFFSLLGVHLNDVFNKYMKLKTGSKMAEEFQNKYDSIKSRFGIVNTIYIIIRHNFLIVLICSILYFPIQDYLRIHPILLGFIIYAGTNQIIWLSRVLIQFKHIILKKN